MFFRKQNKWLIMLLMLLFVPLAGELKFHPLSGDFANFQVSLGSPVFLLFILSLPKNILVATGFSAGIVVVLFRSILDYYILEINFMMAVINHLPTFFYYFIYASLFMFIKLEKGSIYNKALMIAGWSILAETAASFAELFANCIVFNYPLLFVTGAMVLKIVAIAVLRCFFILSFFFLAQIYTMELRMQQERQEKEKMLLLITDIYNEILQLKRSQKNAEDLTRECYKIYEQIKAQSEDKDDILSQKVLALAGALHEIKKDNQRIHAGFMTLMNTQQEHIADYLAVDDLLDFIVNVHKQYAKSLHKRIKFTASGDKKIKKLHAYILLALINNIVSNAVEAITATGSIEIKLQSKSSDLLIEIKNSGSFIQPKKLELIFQAGYTTKFASDGTASTGVGLSYVQQHVKSLGGSVKMESDGVNEVKCTIYVPLSEIEEKC